MNKNRILILVGVLVLIIVGGGIVFYKLLGSNPLSQNGTGTKIKPLIGFSLGTLREERWQKDADYFTEKVENLGGAVKVQYSGEDAKLQISQAENLILQGAKVLVVVPYDASTAGAIVEKAHAANVKVIAYDRMIPNSDVDLFITFDSRVLGKLQAQEIVKRVPKGKYAYVGGSPTDNNALLLKEGTMGVLSPLIKKGDITIVTESFTPNWQPEDAYRTLKNYLASGKTVDAVVAANDGTASGVIRALKEVGLAGKVPVSGQDAEITACQRLIDGTQAMTIYKPLEDLAKQAAEEAMRFAQGKNAHTNGSLNNGKINVPSYFLDPIVVTKSNLDKAIIDSGFHTREEIYGKK